MSEFTKRLRYSVASGACVDGNIVERERCSEQMYKAALKIEQSEQELANLDAELTETLMAVADLMDENADLNHQLAGVYKSCISAMYSVVMGSASLDTRTAFESAEGAIRALIPKEATDD